MLRNGDQSLENSILKPKISRFEERPPSGQQANTRLVKKLFIYKMLIKIKISKICLEHTKIQDATHMTLDIENKINER